MPIGWAVAVVTLGVAVVVLAIVVLGLVRQVIPLLERATASAEPSLVIGPEVGSQLPDIPARGADGTAIHEQLHHRRPAVLLFLTPGCGPCQLLAEELRRLDLASLPGHLLIVTTPEGPKRLGIPSGMPILTELDREVSDPLSVIGTPFVIAVAEDGTVWAKHVPATVQQVLDLASAIAPPTGLAS